jgi:hypothetical protein
MPWFLALDPQLSTLDRHMPPKISLGPFHFTSVGVRITGKPEIADWKGPLQFALWCQRAGPWWIGDLLNSGEDRFGETFSQMCEGAVSAEMLNRYASVARRVPLENRRPGLSWSAHAVTARLPHDLQHDLLVEAERLGWTTDELRAKAREAAKQSRE